MKDIVQPLYRIIFSVFSIVLVISVHGQNNSFMDFRDGTTYTTVKVNDLVWMTDNLVYETSLSKSLTEKDRIKNNLQDIEGRYYHFQELDSVCPAEWSLPTYQDWIDYFLFINEGQIAENMKVSKVDDPHHHYVLGYEKQIDLFEPENPLNLKPVGRFEGSFFSTSIDIPFADYWTKDDIEEYPGTTHIHLMNPWTTIHSHKHHMKPRQKEKIRRFMVRCVNR